MVKCKVDCEINIVLKEKEQLKSGERELITWGNFGKPKL